MQFQFMETMRGQVEKQDSAPLRFYFTIKAQAPGYIAYVLGDPLDVTGTASLEGIADRAPVAGTLHVGLPVRRRLQYDLSFRVPDSTIYRYMGRKDVSYFHFLRTMSWLRGTLFRNGEPVGRAELWFNYRDLPSFILSFRPGILPALRHAARRLRLFH